MATFESRALELRPSHAVALVRAAGAPLLGVLVAILLQFVVRPLVGDYVSKILLDICTNVVLAVSLTIVNGFTGQFSIGHAAFMAVGGYTTACIVYYASYRIYGDGLVHGGLISTMQRDRDVPLVASGDILFAGALFAGGLAAACCGYLVGLPSLRLRGDYLAIVTLGFGEIVRVLIQQTTESLYDPTEINATPIWKYPMYVGGGLGFTGLPFYSSLFWGGLLASGTVIAAYRLKNSSTGRAFLSIREDEVAAEAMGVRTTRYKVSAFVIAAFFAGMAGGLFAHTNGVQLNPAELGFLKSFDIIIMVVLGGMGSVSGAAIAAAILTVLPELLRDPPSVWPWGVAWGVIAAIISAWFAKRPLRAVLVIAGALVSWELMRFAARSAGVELSEYRMVLYAIALIAMMIARPQGLLGLREIWELRPARRGGAR